MQLVKNTFSRVHNNAAQTVIARLIIILLVGTLPGTINCSYCVVVQIMLPFPLAKLIHSNITVPRLVSRDSRPAVMIILHRAVNGMLNP